MFNCAFIYIAEGISHEEQHAYIPGSSINMQVVGVGTYEEAVEVAKTLADAGADAIELCAGFGYEGTAMIKEAVPGIPVGSVKFDFHPAMGWKSGDDLFK